MAILQSQTATGLSWVQESMALFKQQTGRWLLIAFNYLLIMLVMSSMGSAMSVISIVLWPATTALILLFYRAEEMGKSTNLSQLLTQLKPNLQPLLFMGLLAAVYFIFIQFLLKDDLSLIASMSQPEQTASEEERMAMMQQILPVYFKLLAMLVPLFVVTWFSPLLIAVNQYTLVKALKSSIAGVLQYFGALNIAWLVLVGCLLLVSTVAGMVIGLLGLGGAATTFLFLLVLVFGTALFFAFQYVCYRDVFRAAPVTQN